MSEKDTLISLIQDVGDVISESVGEIEDDSVQEWINKHGLDEVPNTVTVVCRLASFNHYLKSALYEEYREEFPSLAPLEDTECHFEAFDQALSESDVIAFREYALDSVAQRVDRSTLERLEGVSSLIDEENASDDIGMVFEKLVPNEARRRLGQFRTPKPVAEFMASWAVTSGDERILDPGMGAGVLTSEAYRQKIRVSDEPDLGDISGVDLSQLAIVMSTTALKIINGEGSPQFYREDYLQTRVMGEASGRITPTSGTVYPTKFDGIVSNPPYSRHHSIKNKEELNELAKSESSLPISMRSPMYLYFYIHAAKMLQEGGRMAFLTPCEFLETDYGVQLKEFLTKNFHIRAIIRPSQDASIFETARTTSCICLLEKGTQKEGAETTFVQVLEDSWPGADELLEVLEAEKEDVNWGFLNNVEQDSLKLEQNWTNKLDPDAIENLPNLTRFGDLATIKRGIATGKNDYFCLSKEEAEEWGVRENEHLCRIIRRTDGLENRDIVRSDWEQWKEQGDEVYLLYYVPDSSEEPDENLEAYLEHGREIGADSSYLAENRDPWYRVDRRDVPEILCDYMSKTGFSFYDNRAGLRSLNNLHNIVLSDDFVDEEKEALLAYLSSDLVDRILEQSGRTYSDSLRKVEPNELKDIPVLDTRATDEEVTSELSDLYCRLCDASRGDEEASEKELVDEIDNVLTDWLERERPEFSLN